MKSKSKKIYFCGILIALGLLILSAIAMLFFSESKVTALAYTSELLIPKANYVKYHYVDGEIVWTGKGQSGRWSLTNRGGGTVAVTFTMTKQNSKSIAGYSDGEYGMTLDFADITLHIGNNVNSKMEISDESGNVLATKDSEEDINITLDEGTYHVNITIWLGPWTNSKGQEECYVQYAEYEFSVDLTFPYLLGTFAEGEEQWVGVGHTVEAQDDQSYIWDFYYTPPDGKTVHNYRSVTSYTFQEGDQEGLYTFYAVDKVRHTTKRKLLFDGAAPEGYFTTEDGEQISAEEGTNQPFVFHARDELSGLKSVEYRSSPIDDWMIYLEGTVISSNSSNSNYEFRCRDVAGNEKIYTMNVEHNFIVQVKNATCISAGYTTYTCNDCGYSYVGETIPEMGHKYSDTRVESTCIEKGYTLHQCVRCENSYKDTPVRELGHDFQSSIIMPTCAEGGYILYSCTRCSETNQTETAKPMGHNYNVRMVAATCTEGGYTLHECQNCGDSYRDYVSLPNGHNFVVGNVTATCTEHGKTQYICQVCDYSYSINDDTYPTGHSYTNTVIKEPTCTEEGIRRCTCDNCGNIYEAKIASNGHLYEITDSSVKNGKTTRIYTCSQCNNHYKQELGNQYAEVSNYVEYLFLQYQPYMWWVLLAAAGVWSIVIGVMIAIAQKHEDKEKSKKMLINYVIGLVVIAVILAACPFLMRGIAALIT